MVNDEPRVERVEHLPDLPCRPSDAHKGTFGRALLIGGARGMPGAIGLAGLSAMRSGAGLVFLAVPDSVQSVVAGYEPSYQVRAVHEDHHGRIAQSALPVLMEWCADATAVAVGPGLDRSAELVTVVGDLFQQVERPLVLDADALNALSKCRGAVACRDAVSARSAVARVLTPHPGEFSRLTGLSMAHIAGHREAEAVRFARTWNVILVLKGPATIVTDGLRVAINQTGNSGMATGGSGDVLTGLIVGLLAQQLPAFEAAQLAVHLHGLAGDLAAAELSQRALVASDLPRFLGAAWKVLES